MSDGIKWIDETMVACMYEGYINGCVHGGLHDMMDEFEHLWME